MQYGQVISPTEVGWVHDVVGFYQTTGRPRVWRKPNGELYEFPPDGPMVLVVGPDNLRQNEAP